MVHRIRPFREFPLLAFLCVAFCLATARQAAAQPAPSAKTSERVTVLPKDQVLSRFQSDLKADRPLMLLDRDLKARGFRPGNGAFGITRESVVGGKAYRTEVLVRDYPNPASKDAAALVHVTLPASGGGSFVRSFILIAPNGDPTKAQSSSAPASSATTSVPEADCGLWFCMKGQLASASSQCAAGLVTCIPAAAAGGGTFSWATYLGCLATTCGWAYGKAAACCACNGEWVCRWAVGNCSQGYCGTGSGSPCPSGTRWCRAPGVGYEQLDPEGDCVASSQPCPCANTEQYCAQFHRCVRKGDCPLPGTGPGCQPPCPPGKTCSNGTCRDPSEMR